MKILLTGAGGFIGRNFAWAATNVEDWEILAYHHTEGEKRLRELCKMAEAVVHLAGVNRPQVESEFIEGNTDFTRLLLKILRERQCPCPVLMASSVQAEQDNPYGLSKRAAEEAVWSYASDTGAIVYIYRLPNVFGKWCRPNYNSVVATFCHHIARGKNIRIDAPEKKLCLAYIDDVVQEFMAAIMGKGNKQGELYKVPITNECSVGRLAQLVQGFAACRQNLSVPNLAEPLVSKLYSTYLSYLPEQGLSYCLSSHADMRGSFTEFMRTMGQGQVSVNVCKPHIKKGGHWHQSKHEKFLVVAGEAVIRLRQVEARQVLTYRVTGERLEVVEIPPGYTHEIENAGETDLVTLMWANENFDPAKPDTYRLEV